MPFHLIYYLLAVLVIVMTLSLMIYEDIFLDTDVLAVLFYLHLRISRRQFPIFDAELNISDKLTLPASIQDKTFIFIRLPEEDASSQLSENDPHSCKYKLLFM